MKKKLLAMLLAAVMAISLLPGTAWALENQTANLTPEISAAYLHVIENLYQLYGAPYKSGEIAYTGEGEAAVYYGMCGGYIVDLGDGGYPEMIVAYSQDLISGLGFHYAHSYIRVYAWNGTEAVSVFEEQVLASGNGRSWGSYFLRQNGNTAWLDRQWEGLPSYDFATDTYDEPWTQLDHLRLENGVMAEFTPQAKETSSVQLGTFDYITFNNYHELKALLENSIVPESSHPYYDILTKCMADINYANLESYMKDECRGLLIDINNDMTEELVIRYPKDYELLCDIWTIKNGQAVCMFSETIGYYAGAGPAGRLMLAECMGETWLTCCIESGSSFTRNNIWTLYRLTDGVCTKQHTFKEFITYHDGYSETSAPVQYFIDEAEVSENEFSSRSIREVKQILNWEYDSTPDGSVYFEALTAKLQNYTTPAPGPSTGFTDVPSGSWYEEAVAWAVENEITSGTGGSTFTPNRVCTHGEIITFLWRAAGKPAATTRAPVETLPYDDFRAAADWAHENGVIDGSFRYGADCTRADTVTYMWKAAGSPNDAPASNFSDVPAENAPAVSWAVSRKVTFGTGDGAIFSPGITCDRAQIVTFLQRAYA